MVQTVCYNELDNMFFEILRKAVVSAGYLPDILNYQHGGSNDARDYRAAKERLKVDIGVLTEIFNTGSFDAVGEKAINKIVIIRGNKNKGSIGGWPATQVSLNSLEWDDGSNWDSKSGTTEPVANTNSIWTKRFTPDNSSDVDYQIKLITNSSEWDNILSSIIDDVIPQKRFLSTVENDGTATGKDVFIQSMGDMNVSAYGFIERTYRYRVTDIFVQNPRVLRVNIPVMSTVNYFIYGNPAMTAALSSNGGVPPTVVKKIVDYRDFAVTFNIVETLPLDNLQTLANGDKIPLNYLLNADGTLTIPYLKWKPHLVPIVLDVYIGNPTRVDLSDPLNLLGDTLDNSVYNGFNYGSVLQMNISMPVYE